MKVKQQVDIITIAGMYVLAVTCPKESRYRSNEGERVSYVLYKYFCESINFMFT